MLAQLGDVIRRVGGLEGNDVLGVERLLVIRRVGGLEASGSTDS